MNALNAVAAVNDFPGETVRKESFRRNDSFVRMSR